MHLALIRLAFFYLLAGMLLGIVMAATGMLALRPVHAHVNLLVAVALLFAAVLRLRAA